MKKRKRKRITNADKERLDEQIIEILRADHPQSVRHVFYRLLDPSLEYPLPKTDSAYKQVSRRLVELRRSGRVAYSWVVDFTRRGWHTATYGGVDQFLRKESALYRAQIWERTGHYVEVWAEARNTAAVLENLCYELAVSLYPAGGYASETITYESAAHIQQVATGRNVTILYAGDLDEHGGRIEKAARRNIERHMIDLDWRRVAVTEEQVGHYGLPSRYEAGKERQVQCQALPASVLRQIVRREIEGLIPDRELYAAKVAEEHARRGINFLGDFTERHGLDTAVDLLRTYEGEAA